MPIDVTKVFGNDGFWPDHNLKEHAMKIALVPYLTSQIEYAAHLQQGLAQLLHESKVCLSSHEAQCFLEGSPCTAVVFITTYPDPYQRTNDTFWLEEGNCATVAVIATNSEVEGRGTFTVGAAAARVAHRNYIPDASALFKHLLYRPPAA